MRKSHSTSAYLLSFVAVSYLFIYLISLFNYDVMPLFFENRVRRAWPEFKLSSENERKETLSRIEDYVADRFPFRAPFYLLINSLRYYIFNVSYDNDTVLGKNGWLYFSSEVRVIKGIHQFQVDYLSRMIKEIARREDYYSRKKIQFYFLLIPLKCQIYPEYLPESISPLEITEDELVIKRLKLKYPRNIIDTYDVLRAAKKEASTADILYFRDDCHMSLEGAGVLAREITSHIRSSSLSTESDTSTRILEKSVDDGTHVRSVGIFRYETSRFRFPTNAILMNGSQNQTDFHNELFPEDKVTRFTRRDGKHRLLIIGDSQAGQLSQAITPYFDDIFFVNIWTQSTDCSSSRRSFEKIVDKFKPSVVIVAIYSNLLFYDCGFVPELHM